MRELCYKARELLVEEGNVVSVDAPVTVWLGRLHAQSVAGCANGA